MKKRKSIITILIILLVLVISIFVLTRTPQDISRELAICIGDNAVLYVQLGCHACKTQIDLFGDNSKYLNIVDCWYEKEKCSEIKYTPTWVINGAQYVGVQSIEELKKLTGCDG